MKAELHFAESRRLAALRGYDILDTPREAEFDDIVELVSAICEAPISVINHPIGHHPFEDDDTDAYSTDIIRRTLDFMRSASAAPIGDALHDVEDTGRGGGGLRVEGQGSHEAKQGQEEAKAT